MNRFSLTLARDKKELHDNNAEELCWFCIHVTSMIHYLSNKFNYSMHAHFLMIVIYNSN